MVRTINVVYTTRKLSGSEARQLKMYMFLCSYDTVKVGDLIVSPMYTTPMQVIGTSSYSAREQMCTVCANKIPHITICTFNGGKPVDSNNITEWKDIEPIIVETKLEKR